jgi:hypothetical protein
MAVNPYRSPSYFWRVFLLSAFFFILGCAPVEERGGISSAQARRLGGVTVPTNFSTVWVCLSFKKQYSKYINFQYHIIQARIRIRKGIRFRPDLTILEEKILEIRKERIKELRRYRQSIKEQWGILREKEKRVRH